MAGVLARYRAWDAAERAAEDIYAPAGDAEWSDENRRRALDSTQHTWDALPLWLRVGLCLRCHWIDAVYEANPRLGEWLVAKRAARR